MDPRWQPHLGPVEPKGATPEACALLAAGWHAQEEECWVRHDDGESGLVSLETWRSLRDRFGFLRPRIAVQRS